MRFSYLFGPRGVAVGVGALLALAVVWPSAARTEDVRATPISLKNADDDRSERRRAARSGRLGVPLPGTPDVKRPLLMRMAAKGLQFTAPVMMRVFKAES